MKDKNYLLNSIQPKVTPSASTKPPSKRSSSKPAYPPKCSFSHSNILHFMKFPTNKKVLSFKFLKTNSKLNNIPLCSRRAKILHSKLTHLHSKLSLIEFQPRFPNKLN